MNSAPHKVKKLLVLFGTRPEAIKLAPVVREFAGRSDHFKVTTVCSSQHTDLLRPVVDLFDLKIDHDLDVMRAGQTPNEVCARVLAALDRVLDQEQPDMIFVQGDTTTALAGALAGFHRQIPVAHVEAGLRSGCATSPFPEEMNRRMISQLASYHFAATENNRQQLLAERVAAKRIFVTGNTVVDALQTVLRRGTTSRELEKLLVETRDMKRLVLTTHRRESFGRFMKENLLALRDFTDKHEDVALIFPVHPNPSVRSVAESVLSDHPRIHLVAPLGYSDFVRLLAGAWLIVSDSGGVQEEAPTLGKALLVLRENTERPEAISSGVARLVGAKPGNLARMLDEAFATNSWIERVHRIKNPFGAGDSSRRIAQIVSRIFGAGSTSLRGTGNRKATREIAVNAQMSATSTLAAHKEIMDASQLV